MDTTGFDRQDDLNALEAPLSALTPLSGGLSRDRMLFEAGRAAARAGYSGRLLMVAAGARLDRWAWSFARPRAIAAALA